MNELVVDKIRWLMDLPEMYADPWKGGFFATAEERSIMRWTCTELMLLILDHPNREATEVIDEFWFKMVYFRTIATSKKVRRTFEIVVDTIDTIQLNL